MSYILDALRKADAQRERDPARGIHAQPGRALMNQDSRDARSRPRLLAFGAAGLAVLAAAGWYMYRDSPASAVGPQVAIAAQVAPSDASAPATAAYPASAQQPAQPAPA